MTQLTIPKTGYLFRPAARRYGQTVERRKLPAGM
jgi:hypothetical protein